MVIYGISVNYIVKDIIYPMEVENTGGIYYDVQSGL